MCGRYGLISNKKDILKRFEIEDEDLDFKENYNASPTHKMPVVERHSPNSLHLRTWGVDLYDKHKYFTINSRADKLSTNPFYKKALETQRCIIPANYFFEWKKGASPKQPYVFKLKEDNLFGFAGLLINYKDEKSREQIGFTIITTEPNSLMEPIHNRMPVILSRDSEEEWLNPDVVEIEKLEKYLKPYPSNKMEKYPISLAVNSPANNSPEILKPLS